MKRSILHMLDPMPNNSPFDINMAVDAGFDILMPYNNVKLEGVHGLTQDAIFSRSPAGLKQTGLFIGGRHLGLAIDMFNTAKQAMMAPFAISVFADPSGAFTTSAALVACVERELREKHGKELAGCKAVVFGGTGPVGIATGIIASLAGADTTIVDHLYLDTAVDIATLYNRRFGCNLKAAVASFDREKIELLKDVDVIFCTAKAGIQVLNATILQEVTQLKVVGDVNAVPPAGIEGVDRGDCGAPLIHATHCNALAVGALAIGDVKYQVQHAMLASMLETEKPIFLDFRDAFIKAQEILK
ncbi:MAG: methylenetetrahydromethanopterin dehydrogenase [Methylococcales bacterium]|jgi:methylene-tetrahydromethanopterin dehydrogenase|nr:methylenetetrahydromethanopterin dehydrogenase [Methylococcales bacterium]